MQNTQISQVNLWALADLCTPWCIRVAATLRIADHIEAGINKINDLAKKESCNAENLHKVLGHLVSQGVFEEPAPGQFALNEPARMLLEPAVRISLDLNGIGGRFAYIWGTMPKYVRTGNPAYQNLFGLPFWQDLEAHPDLSDSFDSLIGPAGHGAPDPEFEISCGWEAIKTVVDVGGGTGAMLAEILRTHPNVKGILVEQPTTVARSGEIFQAAGVSERVGVVGQSFFNELPPGADLYLLRGVLNDWPDREAGMILRRCAEAANPNGRVVIIKGVQPDDSLKDLTIEMILVGGKYRTVTEIDHLARKAGLKVISIGQQASGHAVVECRPI